MQPQFGKLRLPMKLALGMLKWVGLKLRKKNKQSLPEGYELIPAYVFEDCDFVIRPPSEGISYIRYPAKRDVVLFFGVRFSRQQVEAIFERMEIAGR